MTELTVGPLPLEALVLLAQAVASGAMCGLIWFVQVVHYPMFAAVADDRSREYARENQRRTTAVVVPFMAVELAAACLLVVWPPPAVGRGAAAFGLALVAVNWLSTLFVQVPLHERLARDGHSAGAVTALVRGNWIRTGAWTARAILAAWMLWAAAGSPGG
jgi:hypothetical protein